MQNTSNTAFVWHRFLYDFFFRHWLRNGTMHQICWRSLSLGYNCHLMCIVLLGIWQPGNDFICICKHVYRLLLVSCRKLDFQWFWQSQKWMTITANNPHIVSKLNRKNPCSAITLGQRSCRCPVQWTYLRNMHTFVWGELWQALSLINLIGWTIAYISIFSDRMIINYIEVVKSCFQLHEEHIEKYPI